MVDWMGGWVWLLYHGCESWALRTPTIDWGNTASVHTHASGMSTFHLGSLRRGRVLPCPLYIACFCAVGGYLVCGIVGTRIPHSPYISMSSGPRRRNDWQVAVVPEISRWRDVKRLLGGNIVCYEVTRLLAQIQECSIWGGRW